MMNAPTPLPELNAVLADFVARCQGILRSNLVGAYLQGSFAVGDFTERSDVDFMIVVRSEIEADTLDRLQRMHAAIHEQPSYWAKHLEGSYAPVAIIRRLTDEPRDPPGHPPRPPSWRDPETGLPPKHYPFLFLGNGAASLVRSEHDNSLVVRWVLRERSIVLLGPAPATLVDPVAADPLRAEVRANLSAYCAPYLARESELNAVWLQGFLRDPHLPDAAHARDRRDLLEESRHAPGAPVVARAMARTDRGRSRLLGPTAGNLAPASRPPRCGGDAGVHEVCGHPHSLSDSREFLESTPTSA